MADFSILLCQPLTIEDLTNLEKNIEAVKKLDEEIQSYEEFAPRY